MFGLQLYGLVMSLLTGVATRRDERGQATAEYALIIAAAAIIGGVVIAWAAKNGALAKLFDVTLGRVLDLVEG